MEAVQVYPPNDQSDSVSRRVVAVFIVLSLAFMGWGMFADAGTMKGLSIGIMAMTLISFVMTWFQQKFSGRKELAEAFAFASFYAFFVLALLIGIVFLIDSLITPVPHLNFAIFAAMFISTMVARMQMASFALERGSA